MLSLRLAGLFQSNSFGHTFAIDFDRNMAGWAAGCMLPGLPFYNKPHLHKCQVVPTFCNGMSVIQSKIRMTEAAKLVGVHRNTLRNWRTSGKLKSAEKVQENGAPIWYVDQAEVEAVHALSNSDSAYSGPPPYNQLEAAVRPLTELIEKQSHEIGDLREQVGTLKERLSNLESRNKADG